MPNRKVRYTSQFKSDLKRAHSHKKCDVNSLKAAMTALEARKPLEPALLNHALRGRYPNQRGGDTDCRECHTSNDWLLVYRLPDEDTVIFVRTGTHSELF
ncbi:MAG: type II toxin-antitoxin system YafQ family toxin [Xanthomonadales bacterium]|nr:type II toxin-antitoxin system YafQ family toxin [Xanthomonadales bacterium]